MTGKVFSVTDFARGLDTRRSVLAAPPGSLRILENAVITQGGEIAKRQAFVNVCTLDPNYLFLTGQGNKLHAFAAVATAPIVPGTCPVPIVGHTLAAAPETIVKLLDAEAYNDKFQVTGVGASGTTYVWYNDVLLNEVGPSQAHGTYSRTYKSKVYRVDDVYLRFSGVGDPSVTDPSSTANPGAGFINMAINDPDAETLTGLEVYYDKMAVFARLMVQMWTLDPDPANDTLSQVLRIGAVASRSITQFGTGDILFLSDSGVRSLKAQNINLAASVSDVGSAIDLILAPVMRANPTEAADACAVVQPIFGRYWLALGETIYVLSYFPAGQITAWSTFAPGFNVQDFAVVESRVFARDPAGNVYLYGGIDQNTYDSSRVRVRFPHHAADEATTNKRVKSVDLVCEGNWSVSMGMVPNNPDIFELVANIAGTTLGAQSIPVAGYGTHVGVHMEHASPGPATISQLHFNIQEGWTK